MSFDESKQILIFGGSFSPPTLAHEAIIAACLALPAFDAVWVLPSGDRLDKQIAATDQDRLRMLRLVKSERFNDNPRLHISDFELGLPRPTMTYQTVKMLQQAFPATDFWFVFGGDAYRSMGSWPHGAELQSTLNQLVIISDQHVARQPGKQIIQLDIAENFKSLSSSHARQLAATGDALAGVVSSPIERYIRTRQLYL